MKVLVMLRKLTLYAAGSDFRVACATTLLTYLVDSIDSIGQTFLVVASALAVEYIATVSVPPSDILKAFCTSLKTSTRESLCD